jgi:hypothetical protein
MELSVLIQQVPGNGYRASCGEPIPATAEGATREEVLAKLRAELESRISGAEVVRLVIGPAPLPSSNPIWPDDPITRDWLAGIAAARLAADCSPDSWNENPDAAQQP